ncbi:IclR helix-turn-helix domain-containing protein [Streptomyces sp. Termitarium-T10T-6]|nr:IclR helix-turn-helix domain-containing protein [Streptomyces sp. Termitarium-T10T-6]
MAKNIQSLERAAAMLRLLAGGERRLGLSDIASSLGLAKGTAHGILRTLQLEGSSSRTRRRAATSWARSCCGSATAIWTSTSCGRAPWSGRTTWPAPAARASTSECCTSTAC